jgi:hypothetical protein
MQPERNGLRRTTPAYRLLQRSGAGESRSDVGDERDFKLLVTAPEQKAFSLEISFAGHGLGNSPPMVNECCHDILTVPTLHPFLITSDLIPDEPKIEMHLRGKPIDQRQNRTDNGSERAALLGIEEGNQVVSKIPGLRLIEDRVAVRH